MTSIPRSGRRGYGVIVSSQADKTGAGRTIMDRFIVCLVLASTIVSGLVVPREYASAQTKSDLVGTWSLVSVTVEQGGQKRDVQGPNPKGLLMLDSTGTSLF
jgi:hypothetical protein